MKKEKVTYFLSGFDHGLHQVDLLNRDGDFTISRQVCGLSHDIIAVYSNDTAEGALYVDALR